MKRVILLALCISALVLTVNFSNIQYSASEAIPKTWCSQPWWSTNGTYKNKQYYNYECSGIYNAIYYKQGFGYGETPNGGDYNRSGLYAYSSGGGGYKCGYPQVQQPGHENQKDGNKVCSGDGKKIYSDVKIGALRGTDYNSYITTT